MDMAGMVEYVVGLVMVIVGQGVGGPIRRDALSMAIMRPGPQEFDEDLRKQLTQVIVGDSAAVDLESDIMEPVRTNGVQTN